MTEQATPPGVSFKTFCLGVGCMDKCLTCQHDKNWQTLNELPDVARKAMQKSMIRVNNNTCQITSGKWYEPVPGTVLLCEHISFSQVDPSLAVPLPEFQFTVTGNTEQLIEHGYSSKYHWEKKYNDYNVLLHKSMLTRFETITQACILYEELRAKGLVGYKNWPD